MNKIDIVGRKARYAQWREEHNFPQFEPSTGICWYCKKQIFEICEGTEAITGCPHCNHSYVD